MAHTNNREEVLAGSSNTDGRIKGREKGIEYKWNDRKYKNSELEETISLRRKSGQREKGKKVTVRNPAVSDLCVSFI